MFDIGSTGSAESIRTIHLKITFDYDNVIVVFECCTPFLNDTTFYLYPHRLGSSQN